MLLASAGIIDDRIALDLQIERVHKRIGEDCARGAGRRFAPGPNGSGF